MRALLPLLFGLFCLEAALADAGTPSLLQPSTPQARPAPTEPTTVAPTDSAASPTPTSARRSDTERRLVPQKTKRLHSRADRHKALGLGLLVWILIGVGIALILIAVFTSNPLALIGGIALVLAAVIIVVAVVALIFWMLSKLLGK